MSGECEGRAVQPQRAGRRIEARLGPCARIPVLFWMLAGLAVALGDPIPGAAAVLDPGNSVETCISCHAANGVVPVGDVSDPDDAHYVDLDPRGPQTPSGYRQLQIDVTAVDVSGTSVIILFGVRDEDDAAVDAIFDSDGRFTLAELVAGASPGDPTRWQNPLLLRSEPFDAAGGLFQSLGGGRFRYESAFDPTAIPVQSGDTLRVAVEISYLDLPPGNGWCDFDASLTGPDSCGGPVARTRDIVQTSVCNGCHGVTSDVMLVAHGGSTQVEYCVTCHEPGQGDTDFTNMIHKIHYGAQLANGYRHYSDVEFTKDIDDCTTCHAGGGLDEDSWFTQPSREACGSCHDDVNFDTGANHGSGAQQPTNEFCTGCHPPTGPVVGIQYPIQTVHQGVARAAEAARYRGGTNGFSIDALSYDAAVDRVRVDYSVTRDGTRLVLQTDPAFANGGRLSLKLGWSTQEYTNPSSGTTPAQPASVNGLDIGGAVIDLGGGSYRAEIDLPGAAFGTLTVGMEGRAVADILGNGIFSQIPIADVIADVHVELRGEGGSRRRVVDVTKCNQCHDAAGAGITVHGGNRSGEINHCANCHNPNATDIAQRPANPMDAVDGKKEESIDLKRMIHQIHRGMNLQNGVVYYGFNGSVHDFSEVTFLADSRNCLSCHLEGTYSTEKAWVTLPSSLDTGADLDVSSDDLNVSQTTAACSSCHDDDDAKEHMLLRGASFMALEADIAHPPELPETTPLSDPGPVPEPARWPMLLVGLMGLFAIHRLHHPRSSAA